MQSFIFLPKIISEMNEADSHNHWQLTPRSIHTYIRAVLKLINKLHASVDAGVVLGVAIVIININTAPNVGVVDFPLDEPPILLPLPHTQSTLPRELVFVSTIIPEANLYIRMDGRTRSGCFTKKSVRYPFKCILLAARLFLRNILRIQVLKPRSRPCAAMVVIKYRTNEVTLTKNNSSTIFDTFSPAKLDAYSAVCA